MELAILFVDGIRDEFSTLRDTMVLTLWAIDWILDLTLNGLISLLSSSLKQLFLSISSPNWLRINASLIIRGEYGIRSRDCVHSPAKICSNLYYFICTDARFIPSGKWHKRRAIAVLHCRGEAR